MRMGCYNAHGEGWGKNDMMFLIVDSGASRHLLTVDTYYTSSQPCNLTISGIGGHKESATKQGVWAGLLQSGTGHKISFSSFGVCIPTNKVNLLSVGQLVHAGNSIVHDGPVDIGHHGMHATLSDGTTTFVPFYWCPDTLLW